MSEVSHKSNVKVVTYAKQKKLDQRVKRIKNKTEWQASPDVKFKELLLTEQKIRPRTDYEWTGKTNS